MNNRIFLIDHQSFNSLAAYDRCMIEGIDDFEFFFFGNENNKDRPDKKNVHYYPVFRYNRYKNNILRGLSYVMSLLIIMYYGIRIRPLAIHLQWIRVWIADWTMIKIFKNCLKSKFVFTVHNLLPRNNKPQNRKHFTTLYHFADLLIAHTETTKKDLIEDFNVDPNKITVMPHGLLEVPVSDEELEESKNKYENLYGFGDKLIFAALGAQSSYKGTDLAIEAWRNNSDLVNNKNLVLLVAGKNIDLQFPKELPENIILISEMISNPDFKYLLRRTDVMVLPYRIIDQSGLLLSLIMERKPYCSTQVGELTKPFEIADVGWIIPEITSESIADTILKIAENPESIATKKANEEGWTRLQREYSWQRSNEILSDAYQKLMGA